MNRRIGVYMALVFIEDYSHIPHQRNIQKSFYLPVFQSPSTMIADVNFCPVSELAYE